MRSLRLLTAMLLAGGLMANPALARHPASHSDSSQASNQATESTNPQQNPDLANADAVLQNTSGVVNQMNRDSNLVNMMRVSRGILIVPNSASGANNAQNAGVLLQSSNGRWTNPVFVSISGSRIAGNQAQRGSNAQSNMQTSGAGSGPVAILIMSNRAMNRILSSGNLSLNRSSGLNMVNYANSGQNNNAQNASRDLVIWSANNTAPPAFTAIRSNPAFDRAIYGTRNMHIILAGRAPLTNQSATNLSTQLPAGSSTVGMIPPPATTGTNHRG